MIGPMVARLCAPADGSSSISGSPEGASALQRENSLFKKMFSLFVGCALALSLAPGAAWAADGSAAQDAVASSSETAAGFGSGAPQPVEEPPAGGAVEEPSSAGGEPSNAVDPTASADGEASIAAPQSAAENASTPSGTASDVSPDAHEPYPAPVIKKLSGDADDAVYRTGEEIGVEVYGADGADAQGEILSGDSHAFTWKIADKQDGEYIELTDENAHKASFLIPSSYAGKSLKCAVSTGHAARETDATPIIELDTASATFTLSSVSVSSSGQLTQVGDTVTPQAMHLVDGGGYTYETTLPSNAAVTYTWYAADDAAGEHAEALSGADAAGALELSQSMQGKYLYVVANAGDNDVASAPFLVESADAQVLTVNARVVGVAEHAAGQPVEAEDWIALSEYRWTSDVKTTAWDVFAQLLDKAGYRYDLTGACPFSITAPDGSRTLKQQQVGSAWSYWSFLVNGTYASSIPSGYVLKDGDVIELRYVEADVMPDPDDVSTNPAAPHPDLGVDWNGYANGGAGSINQTAKTPTESAETKWTASLLTDEERKAGAILSVSDSLIVGGKLYVVSGSTSYGATGAATISKARLSVIDPASGKAERTVQLATSMDSTCRPVYSDGVLVIPLTGGYLQAVSASTLETIWVARGIAGAQALSSLTVADGYVYVATADEIGSSGTVEKGTVRRYNIKTGALAGTASNETSGFYWSGGASVDGYYVVPDDAGTVTVYSGDLSSQVASLKVSARGIRSAIVADGGYLFVASTDGVLHKLALSADGTLRELGKASFAAYSTSTPTAFGGKLYVGGSLENRKGVLAVVDAGTLAVTQITQADGADLMAEVKSTPLVSSQGDGTYVYFTCNGAQGPYPHYTAGGGVYAYKLGDKTAYELYAPEQGLANYCMASVIVGSDGTLYYTNDSGVLFALKAGKATPPEPGKPEGGESESGNQKGDAGSRTGDRPHAPIAAAFGKAGLGAEPKAEAPSEEGEAAATTEAKGLASQGGSSVRSQAAAADGGASPEDGGLNGWAVAGIAVGAVVLVGAALAVFGPGRKRSGAKR